LPAVVAVALVGVLAALGLACLVELPALGVAGLVEELPAVAAAGLAELAALGLAGLISRSCPRSPRWPGRAGLGSSLASPEPPFSAPESTCSARKAGRRDALRGRANAR
jgi:hypothetical protein